MPKISVQKLRGIIRRMRHSKRYHLYARGLPCMAGWALPTEVWKRLFGIKSHEL